MADPNQSDVFPKMELSDLEPWNDRLDAVVTFVEEIDQRIGIEAESTARKATISSLVKHLQVFGAAQFDFFGSRLQDEAGLKLLSTVEEAGLQEYRSIDYAIPEFILGLIVRKIANDALIFQKALDQRRLPTTVSASLAASDRLAYFALKCLPEDAIDWIKTPVTPTVLTYLQRDLNVRIVPYAPVALVGIPVSSITHVRDRLAVAHEMAHFLYWHGKGSTDASDEYLYFSEALTEKRPFEPITVPVDEMTAAQRTNSAIWQWREEIFADVVSLIIAGPVAGYSMLERQATEVGVHFDKNRGTHPPASIRPYVHIYALEELGVRLSSTPLAQASVALAQRWGEIRDIRSAKPDPTLIPDPQDQVFFLLPRSMVTENPLNTEVVNPLKQMVKTVIDLLPQDWIEQRFDTASSASTLINTAWTQQLDMVTPYQEIDLLFAKFEAGTDAVRQQLGIPEVTEFTEVLPEADLDTLWNQLAEARAYKTTGTDIAVTVPPETWLRVLQFAGWTTEGPTGRAH